MTNILIDANGDVYYTPSGDGNATLIERSDGVWAIPVGALEPQVSDALTPPGSLVFSAWAGTTGDVVEGVLRVKGPVTECAITAADGSGVSFSRTLTASQYVYVDIGSFQAWFSSSADAWEPTSTPVLLDYPAAGPLRVSPTKRGVKLAVMGAGFTSASRVVLRANKFWL